MKKFRTFALAGAALLPAFLLLRGVPAAPDEQAAVPVLRGLASPQAIASNPQAVPFIATAAGQITELAGRNAAAPLAATEGKPEGLAFDAAGDLYAADAGRHAILKITPWGEVSVFADRPAGASSAPSRIAIASNGVLYFTDTGTARVYRLDGKGQATPFASGLTGLGGIAVAAGSGEVFLGDGERNIWKISPDGRRRSVLVTFADQGQCAGMALDNAGNLYVARDGGGKVSVVSPEGRVTGSYAVPGPRVTDVAFGGSELKDLYITEAQSGAVYRARTGRRAQRLPWEPDRALDITEPVDGAILNRHDGEVTPEGLRITVKGQSRGGDSVRVNGQKAAVSDGRFETSLVLRGFETRVRAEANGTSREITVYYDKDSFPRYRVSTDDNIWFLRDIARHAGTYKSIFENDYLGFWREMHRKYGAKVHFNIYYETEGFNLAQMPDKFKPEWRKNADWIHLSFHARANDPDRPYLHTSAERIRQDYRLVNREIERFAGRELMTPYTTVHWGALTRAGAHALRQEGVRGLVGYFMSSYDLPSVCYYLPLAQWKYLSGRDYWKDMREDIVYIRHDIVINTIPLEKIVPYLERIVADPHQAEIMELMIHEQYFYPTYGSYEPDYRQRVERAIGFVAGRGYKPVFYDEGFLREMAAK